MSNDFCGYLKNEIATSNERAHEVFKLLKLVSEERDTAYSDLDKISKAVGSSGALTISAILGKIQRMKDRLNIIDGLWGEILKVADDADGAVKQWAAKGSRIFELEAKLAQSHELLARKESEISELRSQLVLKGRP